MDLTIRGDPLPVSGPAEPRARCNVSAPTRPASGPEKPIWQRAKMATDPYYRANQRDCQHRWQHQHPQDRREYRQQRVDYRERNRLLQQHRDQKRHIRPLAKMDGLETVTSINEAFIT